MGTNSIQYKTTLGFNNSHVLHKNILCEEHPESPLRIDACRKVLEDSGLIQQCQVIQEFPASDDLDLRQTHEESYVNKLLREATTMDQDSLNHLCESFDSVFMTPGSVEAAKSAVSCCRWLAECIVEGRIPNAFAIVRPPGHHALRSSACGFCIFNNAGQAAEAAFNFGADRILIVDLDVHHGNGTQKVFYEDKRVLYFSIHRYEDARYWPHLRESNYDHIGDHEGKGYNVNVPLNEVGCGDADYMLIFWNVLWPLASQFNPNLVIVSAGYDCCEGDPLGCMCLSIDAYSHIIYHLSALAGGKLLLILEGGYNYSVTAAGIHRCVRVLCGYKPLPFEIFEPPKKSTVKSCLDCISALRGCWSCFDFHNVGGAFGDFDWKLHEPDIVFNPPNENEIVRTGNIYQMDLVQVDWRIEESAPTKTLILHNGDTGPHSNLTDDGHPEKPQRTCQVISELGISSVATRCDIEECTRSATDNELEAVHDRPYVRRMKSVAEMSDVELSIIENGANSVFLTRYSFNVAARAVGTVLECVDRVLSGKAGELNAFAVVRPPGHHAGISEPSGFCIFNNVAAAAQYAIDKYRLRRVLIVDWDVHHGNGTQEIFYEDDRVLYMSMHRHDRGAFFPAGEPKGYEDVGEKKGKGYSVNIPWNCAKVGDDAYRAAFAKVIMPIAYEFNPELVLVSAGFDAALGDPLGEYTVTADTFALMTYQLMGLAGGRIIAALEGGYNLNATAQCALAVCQVLLDGSIRNAMKNDGAEEHRSRLSRREWDSIRGAAASQEPYWNCLKGMQKHFGSKMMRKQKKQVTSASTSSTTLASVRRSPRIAAMHDLEEQMKLLTLQNVRK